jgi:hypothetical protein
VVWQINRPVIGPDDYIGGKSWPTRPSQVDEKLGMVVDVRDDFLGARIVYSSAFVSAGSVTQYGSASFASLVCPSDEAWFVHWVAAYAPQAGSLGAGQTIQISAGLYLRDRIGGGNSYHFDAPSNVATVGQIATPSKFDARQWISGGMSAALQVLQLAAGPVNVMVTMAYTPVKA